MKFRIFPAIDAIFHNGNRIVTFTHKPRQKISLHRGKFSIAIGIPFAFPTALENLPIKRLQRFAGVAKIECSLILIVFTFSTASIFIFTTIQSKFPNTFQLYRILRAMTTNGYTSATATQQTH